jgi:RimJ/RimL family protein N-acetyltransferase
VAITHPEWLTDRPAERIKVGDLVLTRGQRTDADDLVTAVNESLLHLRPWMPWAQEPATLESIEAFLREAASDWDDTRAFPFVVRRVGTSAIVGCAGLHARLGPRALELGYWLHVDEVGRGVATTVARALTETALSLRDVDRVEIHCDAANTRSAAIPRRLGYRLEAEVTRAPTTPGETDSQLIWVLTPT